MKVSVVIPNWNGRELLGDCLSSLRAQTQKHQVIVVDNGSSDDSVEYIKNEFPEVEIIQLDKNYGFTSGVNPGIKKAMLGGAQFVALLNNDAQADKNWLASLVKTANNHPRVGIVASKIMRADREHLDSTGEVYTIWGLSFPRGRNEVDKGQYDNQQVIFGASGGASLYRVKMLEEIGLFDEDFFAYFEDVDISFRAQLAGWKVRYEPNAVVYHQIGATSSKLGSLARYHSAKNFMLLYAKNMPLKLYFKYLPLFILQFIRWSVSSMIRFRLLVFIKGSVAACWQHPRTLKKRRQIQKNRKVSVKYIDKLLYHHRPPRPPKLEKTL